MFLLLLIITFVIVHHDATAQVWTGAQAQAPGAGEALLGAPSLQAYTSLSSLTYINIILSKARSAHISNSDNDDNNADDDNNDTTTTTTTNNNNNISL